MKHEKKIIFTLLAVSAAIFFVSGLHNLAKFETVDEHFWKYDRVPKYWKAIKERNWKKTYINDKPGITVALFSGLGLPWSPDPTKHRIRDPKITLSNELTVYDEAITEKINFALRFPILLANTFLLFFFFWIIKKITDSAWIALFSMMFMALSPILIGISQIMNPDAFLWSFSAGALLSFLAHLKFPRYKKYLILTGLFTGLSLLSKYTANILFPLYFLLIFGNYLFNFEEIDKKEGARKYFFREISVFFLIFLASAAVFSFFMPSVFIKAKHLYRGTIGFPGLKMVIVPMMLAFVAVLTDIFALESKNIKKICRFLFNQQKYILKVVSGLTLAVFVVIIINCWTGQNIINFDTLRAEAYFEKEMTWGGLLDKHSFVVRLAKEFLVEVYPFVFSLSPLALLLVFSLWIKIIFGRTKENALLIFFLTILPIIYFSATLMSKVLTNPRYSIMLYPLFALLGGIAAYELRNAYKFRFKEKTVLMTVGLIILFSGVAALWTSKPFFFNYTNSLLSKNFIITDAWGYGEYEAAEYLNSLPDAEKLIIWSDRSAICQFIKGACVRDYKIDLTKVVPDYFVISKRGTIRHRFIWEHPELAKKDSFDYYADNLVNNPEWSLYIHDRPENFIKIIKSEEK